MELRGPILRRDQFDNAPAVGPLQAPVDARRDPCAPATASVRLADLAQLFSTARFAERGRLAGVGERSPCRELSPLFGNVVNVSLSNALDVVYLEVLKAVVLGVRSMQQKSHCASIVALFLVVAGCKGNPDSEKAAPAETKQAVITNRIDIPGPVRSNLGITFARVERRAVANTIRVPGRFELLPTARAEVPHASSWASGTGCPTTSTS